MDNKTLEAEVLCQASAGNTSATTKLLEECSTLSQKRVVEEALRTQNVQAVDTLFGIDICHQFADTALLGAVYGGNTHCLAIVLPHCHSSHHQNMAVQYAAEKGHAECVRMLLAHIGPTSSHTDALIVASARGHADCVRLLVNVGDAQAHNSQALQAAVLNNHTACWEMLYDVSAPQEALVRLRARTRNASPLVQWSIEKFAQRVKADENRQQLDQALAQEKQSAHARSTPKM